jgi:hypothetical protein
MVVTRRIDWYSIGGSTTPNRETPPPMPAA